MSEEQQALHDIRQFQLFGNTEASSAAHFLEVILATIENICEDLHCFIDELQPGCVIPADIKLVIMELQEIHIQMFSRVVQVIEANYN